MLRIDEKTVPISTLGDNHCWNFDMLLSDYFLKVWRSMYQSIPMWLCLSFCVFIIYLCIYSLTHVYIHTHKLLTAVLQFPHRDISLTSYNVFSHCTKNSWSEHLTTSYSPCQVGHIYHITWPSGTYTFLSC